VTDRGRAGAQASASFHDVLGGTRISEQAWQNSFTVAIGASPYAAHRSFGLFDHTWR
jgi:hypothetical protein